MPDFFLEIVQSSIGARIVRIAGPLTLNTLFEFQSEVRKDEETALVVDLAGVPYMDSAGLGSVLGAYASCQRTGRGFAVAGPPDRVMTLFRMSRVDSILPIYASLEAAEGSLARAAGA